MLVTLPHLKIATAVFAVGTAVGVSLDPTVKVALIMATPTTIVGLGTLILGFLTRRDQKKMQTSIDGVYDKMQGRLIDAKDELTVKSVEVGRLEGAKVASEDERARAKS